METEHAPRAEVRDQRRARVAPWRHEGWGHPVAQDLRDQVCARADELARLRQENALLRRWVNSRLGGDRVEPAGE